MIKSCLLSISVLFLVSCGFFPERVTLDDPRIQPLLQAAATFDRTSFGFTPLPKHAKVVYFESKPSSKYDAMLHISAETSRTIAFRKMADGTFKWIEEQEIFKGPKKYTTVDGTSYEQICLTYAIEPVSGYRINQLNVSYLGDDSRLKNKNLLTFNDVQPVLKEWSSGVAT